MKKLITIAALIFGTCAAQAEDYYLWWMISDEGGKVNVSGWDTGWTYARIKASAAGEESVYLNLYAGDQTTVSDGGKFIDASNGDGTTKDVYAAALGSYTLGNGWTYALEVYNSDKGWNGMAAGSMPSNLDDYISIGQTTYPAQIFNFGTMPYTNVPEPNSAMLLLLGLSALALRRKRGLRK